MSKSKRLVRLNSVWLCTAGLAGAMGLGAPALAQQTPVSDEITEVVITGSRTIRDGSTAPSPVSVLAVEELRDASPRNYAEGLAALPALRGTSGSNTAGAAASRNFSGAFLNLRALEPKRTLVLLDGRRVAPSATDGSVDFNMLPQSLIRRVDIVTGGASAAYGSDAVAGVVNVILDNTFQGVKGTIQGGISDKGDVGNYRFELTSGAQYMDGRLKVLASYGNVRTNGVFSLLQRGWANVGDWRLPVTANTAANPTPITTLSLLDVRFHDYPGGAIFAVSNTGATFPAALRNLKFLPGGVVSPYNPGRLEDQNSQVGGDAVNYSGIGVAALLEQETGFARATFDLTEKTELFLEGAFAETHNAYTQGLNRITPTATQYQIFSGNPYLPAFVQQTMTSTSTASFLMGRGSNDFRPIRSDISGQTMNLVAGFKTEVFEDWRLSGYWQHGESDVFIQTVDSLVHDKLYASVDAVRAPNGDIVCWITLNGTPAQRAMYKDCVPTNLFGIGGPSEAAKDYIQGSPQYRFRLRQVVQAMDIAGEPFELPAGPLSFAFGIEHRELVVEQKADPTSYIVRQANGIRGYPVSLVGVTGGYTFTNQSPFAGRGEVSEAYTELNVPLLKDVPLAQDLSLNGAYRYTDYSLSGPVETWKVGLSYTPISDVRFRVTQSHDIRAPSPFELFQGNAQAGATITDFINSPTTGLPLGTYRTNGSTRGNPNLKPEEADTRTIGVVLTPSWTPGLTVTVDWYDIKIEGAMQPLNSQQTVDECRKGSQISCDNLVRDANGIIQTVLLPILNLAELSTSGVDLEVGYRTDLPNDWGRLGIRTYVGYLDKMVSIVPGSNAVDLAGEVSLTSNPRVRALAQINWDKGPVGINIQQAYVGHGHADLTKREGLTINNNRVNSYTTTNVGGQYRFGADSQYEAYVVVTNLTDQNPPRNSARSQNSPTNGFLYDTVGRSYVTGLRFRF